MVEHEEDESLLIIKVLKVISCRRPESNLKFTNSNRRRMSRGRGTYGVPCAKK